MNTATSVRYTELTNVSYQLYTALLDRAREMGGVPDGGGTAMVTAFTTFVRTRQDNPAVLIVAAEFAIQDGELEDISWMRFKAHMYALYTDCIEDIRRTHAVRDGKSLAVAAPMRVTHEHVFEHSTLAIQVELRVTETTE